MRIHHSKHFRFAEPPIELGELVHEIANVETSETWARYERSEAKGGAVIHHVRNEVIVALVDLQQRLELVASRRRINSHASRLMKWNSMRSG